MELIDLENCYNFSISNDLTQMVNIPTPTLGYDSLLFWIYFFLLTQVFALQWLSLHWESDNVVVSVSIDFPINLTQDAPFHCIAYDYSCTDWDGIHDYLRDVPGENIFKLSASTAGKEFCE